VEKSNLVNILRTLDKKEVRDLKKWVISPAHNQREDIIALYDYLFDNNVLKKGKKLGKELAFESVYPNEGTYDDAKMRQCMYFFLKSLEDFLVYKELKEDEMRAKSILAKVFRKRRLNKAFEKNMKSTVQNLEKQTIQNSLFHQNNYLLRSEEVRFTALTSRGQEIDFQGLSDSLDIYFMADKLRQSTTLISHQTVYKKTYDLGILEEVLSFLEREKQYLETPAIGMYYYALKCATDREEPSHFTNFKLQIEENSQFFPLFELRDLYLIAINYCINRLNVGMNEYLRELFNFYRKGITRKILMEEGILSRFTFQNLVVCGTKLKEFEWLSQFISEYDTYIEPKYRENVVHYSRSMLEFEKGNYDEAMKLLNQIDYDDILMTLSGKSMQLRMYYELGYEDALESLISSTKAYIQRKKVIGYHKKSYSNLLKYINKLTRVNPYDRAEKKKLMSLVQTENTLAAKHWLIQQIEQL